MKVAVLLDSSVFALGFDMTGCLRGNDIKGKAGPTNRGIVGSKVVRMKPPAMGIKH